MFYSSEKNTCYDPAYRGDYERSGAWPSDAVEISDELFAEVVLRRPPEREMQPGPDGLPILVDRPGPTAGELRTAARACINQWRDQQERAAIVFDHAGHRWDASLQVRDRLNATLGSLNAYGLPAGFFWTDADNIDVPMTQLELQALAEAHERASFARGWQIHARQRELKRQVDAANAEELASFRPDWPGTAAA